MNAKNRLIGIAAVSLAALGSNAYAGQDSKILAGNACQFTDPKQIVNPSLAFSGGRILNTSSFTAFVVCPVVRDNIKNTDGTIAVLARVNGASGENVLCTLTSYDRFAKFIADDFNVGGKDGPQSVTLDVNQSVGSGSYELRCLLPRLGSVLSYQVAEPTPTEEQN